MRKKYLSALLFGALLVTSAGTFTSCKDYDDDINNLQEQITANADAIKKLQEMIGDGKFVTNVAAEANGLKVTWNDGTSTVIENVINGETQSGDVVTINEETGEIVINGEGTGFFATTGESETPGEVKLPYVNEEGILVLVNVEGEEVVTGIRVAPVTAVVNEDGSAVLTIIAADGTTQEIKVPSAASMITSIDLKDPNTVLTIFEAQFNANAAKDWKGKATLPAHNSYIVSTSAVDVRVNPVSAPATEVEYYITNTENKSLSNIVLTASATDIPTGGIIADNIGSRATYSGNGLFTLAMKQTIMSEADGKKLFNADGEVAYFTNKALAINANNTTRSAYGLTAVSTPAPTLTAIQIKNYATDEDKVLLRGTGNIIVDKDKVYTIEGVDASALYDVYFEVSEKDATNYGVVVDDLARTFKITKRPDVSTAATPLKLTVHTLDVRGNKSVVEYNVGLSDVVSADAVYEPMTFQLSSLEDQNDNNDALNISMSVLKEAMGETKWQEWFNATNLAATSIAFYTDEACTTDEVSLSASGLDKKYLKADGKTEATDAADLATIVLNVKENAGLYANKQYYVKITFNNAVVNGQEVNHIVVPVTFVAPVLADMFEIASGYWNNELETITAYFRNTEKPSTAVVLTDYFNKYVEDATVVALSTSNKVGETNKTEDSLFDLSGNVFANNTTLDFDINNKGIIDGKPANGYGQILNLKVVKDNYLGWEYAEENDGLYAFNIRLMSPIYEGTIKVTNNEITINGNDLVEGAKVTDAMIKGIDYNTLEYSLMPGEEDDSWATPQIAEVTFDTNGAKYIKAITPENAVAGTATEPAKAGYFKVTGQPVESTASEVLPIKVEDKWGLVLEENVTFNVVRN